MSQKTKSKFEIVGDIVFNVLFFLIMGFLIGSVFFLVFKILSLS